MNPILTDNSVGADKSYSVTATKLAPSTTYYYRAYLNRGGLTQYASSIYSFTTASTDDVVTTGSASDILSVKANVSGSFNLPSTAYSSITCGVCYSVSNALPTMADQTVTATTSTNDYTLELTGLNSNTLYYYRSYIIVDGRVIYGETRAFTTKGANTSSSIAITGTLPSSVNKIPVIVTCTANIDRLDFNEIVLGICWSDSHSDPTLNDQSAVTYQMDADGKYTAVLTGLKRGTTYHYRSYVKTDKDIYFGEVKTFKTDDALSGYDYVEIGGVKWATMNLGASAVAGSPSECYGDFYVWGETEPRYTSITLDNDNFASFAGWKSNHAYGYSSSDCPSFTGRLLDSDHDAATQKWGDGWSTPTRLDFQKLIKACYGSYTASFSPVSLSTNSPESGVYWLDECQKYLPEYTGVAGVLFVDGIDPGKRVFFPAAGRINDMNYSDGGLFGCYWSSSICSQDSKKSYSLGFSSLTVESLFYDDCCKGLPIRPVLK